MKAGINKDNGNEHYHSVTNTQSYRNVSLPARIPSIAD